MQAETKRDRGTGEREKRDAIRQPGVKRNRDREVKKDGERDTQEVRKRDITINIPYIYIYIYIYR